MFDFFKKKPSNVVPFPEKKHDYIPPEPPKEEKTPATTYYRLGITSDNRVSFQMGYGEITMNSLGVDNLIKQLELFKQQIIETNQPDNETDQ